jgi:PST family polysaccharide transporter
MINKAKQAFKNKDTKRLLSNFSYMTVIELSNYILPFIAIPYIVRVIGVEKYGIIMFAYAIMAFFDIITSYGFKLLAPKYVSLNRDNINKVSKYFWSVIITQLLLLVISLLIFLVLLFSIEQFNQEKTVFLFSFIMIIGNIFFPIWFFQGIERMKYIAIFSFVSKGIYTLMVFAFIKESSDYLLVPLFNSLSFIGVGLASLYFIHKEFKVKFFMPAMTDIKKLLIEGWHIFLSTISNTLYTSVNTVLLGFLTNYTAVGILSLATTISNAVTKIIRIYSSVTFPYMAKYTNNKKLLISKAKLLLKAYAGILIFTGTITLLVASFLIPFVYGEGKEESIILLQILAVVIMFEPLGSFFTSYLVIKNEGKTVSKIAFFTMIMNFILIIPAILFLQALGVVIVKFIVEGFHLILNIKYNKELFLNTTKKNNPL